MEGLVGGEICILRVYNLEIYIKYMVQMLAGTEIIVQQLANVCNLLGILMPFNQGMGMFLL